MALTNSEKQKRYEARYPDRVAAYRASDSYKLSRAKTYAKYRAAHPDRIEAAKLLSKPARDKYFREYREKNREIIRSRSSAWQKRNASRVLANTRVYQANKTNSTPAWANKFFMEEAYDLAARRTALKSGCHEKWHVDHIVPLKSDLVCGLHVHNNLQVVPAIHNMKKGNRHWPDMPGASI